MKNVRARPVRRRPDRRCGREGRNLRIHNRLARLEKSCEAAELEAFFRCLTEHRDQNVCDAMTAARRLMADADAACGRELTSVESLEIPGIDAAMDRLIRAVHACEARLLAQSPATGAGGVGTVAVGVK
jgi:hypothetical protein